MACQLLDRLPQDMGSLRNFRLYGQIVYTLQRRREELKQDEGVREAVGDTDSNKTGHKLKALFNSKEDVDEYEASEIDDEKVKKEEAVASNSDDEMSEGESLEPSEVEAIEKTKETARQKKDEDFTADAVTPDGASTDDAISASSCAEEDSSAGTDPTSVA